MSPVPNRPLAAAAWMSGCIAAFSAMAIASRSIHGVHDTFELMLWRSAIGFLIVVAVGGVRGKLAGVKSGRLPQHLARNLVHYAGQNLWFFAIPLIPLAQVFALEFTSPIWVMLLAALFLGERMTWAKGAAAVLGFAGVLVVARPDFGHVEIGVLAAAASAVCFGATSVITKALTRVEGILSILFWLTLMQTAFSLIVVLSDGAMVWPTAQTAPWLVVLGVSGIGAHFCLTKALTLAPASVVVPVDFARLPVIAVIGWGFYGEVLEPSVAIGAAMIFAGIVLNLRAPRPPSGGGSASTRL
ncbi:MAG: DMT family transporter [Paracoccaceae bacterium]